MDGSIAPHVPQEATLDAIGKTWRLAIWDRGIWRKWLDWAKTVLPDPLVVAERAIERLSIREQRLRREGADLGKDQKGNAARLTELDEQILACLAQQERLSKAALEKSCSYLAIGSEEVQSLLRSHDGQAHLLCLLLEKHQPDVTDEVAADVVLRADKAQLKAALQRVQGTTPEAKNESGPAA